MLWWLLLACPRHGSDTDPRSDDFTPRIVSSEACDACGGDCVIEHLVYPARYHVTAAVDYPEVPPAGGPHNRCWADWGVHDAPVEDDNWVHNLEHGGVVLLWNCPDGCDADVAAIDAFATARDKTVTTPYDALPTRFGVVAWEWRMLTGCFDESATTAFYDAHVDKAPESSSSMPPTGCGSPVDTDTDTDAD
jgi:hypothetical protein